MINLEELEKAIDELLASETEESLNQWLTKQPAVPEYMLEDKFFPGNFKSQHV